MHLRTQFRDAFLLRRNTRFELVPSNAHLGLKLLLRFGELRTAELSTSHRDEARVHWTQCKRLLDLGTER